MTATYIALEGPDGVGKSTVATALKELLLHRPYDEVRIRHFPTRTLTQCAQNENRTLKAEDYVLDMENWLSLRPEPVLFPDTPRNDEQSDTLYILDRWVLSTAVYAHLRGEAIPPKLEPTLDWLLDVPLTTFVLMPRRPEALTDPDYPDPDGYDPVRVTDVYRSFLANAFIAGRLAHFIPIVVDRSKDTPESIANEIAEWTAGLQEKKTEEERM